MDVGKAIREVVAVDWRDRDGGWTEYIQLRLSHEGFGKMRSKGKRIRGSSGELTKEIPNRIVHRKLFDCLSPSKAAVVANNLDIIFLSETKMNANDFHNVQNKYRMQNGLSVSFEGRSGGLAL
ncbi:hypothetical protein Goari_024979, partial [Gossypium aridum]|nr:hypothetical protein [Gossypium aridum]